MSDGRRTCHVCGTGVPSDNAFCGSCGTRLPVTEIDTDDGLIGRVIDSRFRVLRLLGAGGMGAVYLAEHVGIGKRVAVKVLRGDLRSRPDIVSRFRREAMAVSKLTDAHTITVFDFGIWKGLVYLVMEYLQGTDLAAVLEVEGRLDMGRALNIAHQICSALAEAHAVGIVHRDLKPENVFITRTTNGDEFAKVLDFGLAKMVAGHDRVDFETQAGALLGTPFFMAPEQVRSQEVDARTDLYALGGLMYRMLTGAYPYTGRTPMEVLEAHLSSPLRTFAQAAPEADLSGPCEVLVRRLMAREPDDRPTTALEADREILVLLNQGTSRPTLGPAPVTPSPAAFAVPSRFSTSTVVGEEPEAPASTAPSVAPPAPAPEPVETPFDPPTRDEFEAYERRLSRRALVRWLMLLALVAGGASAVWFGYVNRAYEPPAFEVEPNNEPAQANRILPDRPIEGHLGARQASDRSDRDIFVVHVPRGRRTVQVTLSGVPRLDLILEGFDEAGKRYFRHSLGGAGEGETLTATIPELKRLLVVVREVWVQGVPPTENSTDAYTLTVAFPPNALPTPAPDTASADAAPTR